MRDHERAMLCYLRLADLSQQKQQLLGRDKFLVLAGAEACRATWLEVADRCRRLILDNNPGHLVGKSASFADAMRDQEFERFLRQLERFCTPEKGEMLLRELDIDPAVRDGQGVDEFARELFAAPHWGASTPK